jgi:hypothetical protein
LWAKYATKIFRRRSKTLFALPLNTPAGAKFVTRSAEQTALQMSERAASAAGLLAARLLPFIPAVALVVAIYLFSVNVPYGDEWSSIPFVERLQDGTWSWAQFMSEPAMETTGLVTAPLAWITDFNVIASMYVGFGFSLLAFILLWSVLELTFRAWHRRLIAPLSIVFALLNFFPAPSQTWLSGLTALQWGVGTLVVALAVWLMARWPMSVFSIAVCFFDSPKQLVCQ